MKLLNVDVKTLVTFLSCSSRMSAYNISPHSGQVLFGQLLGMADYVSSPLGECKFVVLITPLAC